MSLIMIHYISGDLLRKMEVWDLSACRCSLNVYMVTRAGVGTIVDYLQLPSLAIVTVPLIIIDNSDQSKR